MGRRNHPKKGLDRFVQCFIIQIRPQENLDSSPIIVMQRQDNGSQGIERSIPCFFYKRISQKIKTHIIPNYTY